MSARKPCEWGGGGSQKPTATGVGQARRGGWPRAASESRRARIARAARCVLLVCLALTLQGLATTWWRLRDSAEEAAAVHLAHQWLQACGYLQGLPEARLCDERTAWATRPLWANRLLATLSRSWISRALVTLGVQDPFQGLAEYSWAGGSATGGGGGLVAALIGGDWGWWRLGLLVAALLATSGPLVAPVLVALSLALRAALVATFTALRAADTPADDDDDDEAMPEQRFVGSGRRLAVDATPPPVSRWDNCL